jgi:hypothetical protein
VAASPVAFTANTTRARFRQLSFRFDSLNVLPARCCELVTQWRSWADEARLLFLFNGKKESRWLEERARVRGGRQNRWSVRGGVAAGAGSREPLCRLESRHAGWRLRLLCP